MDPFNSLSFGKDTSFAFMRGAARRGHEVWHCLPEDVTNRGRDVFARATRLSVNSQAPFLVAEHSERLELSVAFSNSIPIAEIDAGAQQPIDSGTDGLSI